MQTPEEKTITFTLHSQPMKDPKARWKVSVTFAAGSSDASPAEVTAVDGDGSPVACGEFEFAGMKIALQNGKGTFRCADFVAGKHESAVWMYRPGMSPVPGMLTFE